MPRQFQADPESRSRSLASPRMPPSDSVGPSLRCPSELNSPPVLFPGPQAQELLGGASPWAHLTNLHELLTKCSGVHDDMIWCLQGCNSLIHRGLLPGDKLSNRSLVGSKYKRSMLAVMLFKKRLKCYLLTVFATEILKLQERDVATLCGALNGFASFDEMSDSARQALDSLRSPAKELAAFIGNVIFGVDMDQGLLTASLQQHVADWVLARPELQCLVTAVAPPELPGAILAACNVPHICSIALPWLTTADKEQDLPPDAKNIIARHTEEVDRLMTMYVRVLDPKVPDDTFGAQLLCSALPAQCSHL